MLLAFGSLAIATVTGIPIGIACTRSKRLRAPVLNVLNIVQTIPSIALFGLLIAPMAWIAATIPGASAIGIAGIGVAPALVALYAYSLLPVVSNTVVGLDGVPRQTVDAASGMGMTDVQRLARVEFPLAFPVILTGIRIVLVQNIGLATIAALIGGGGFGVFVFQGIGQTAMDLVLLGAVPTVALAVGAAVVLDALIELSERPGVKEGEAGVVEIDDVTKGLRRGDRRRPCLDQSRERHDRRDRRHVGLGQDDPDAHDQHGWWSPTSGVVRIDGEDNRALPAYELRRRIGLRHPGPRPVSRTERWRRTSARCRASSAGTRSASSGASTSCWSSSSSPPSSSASAMPHELSAASSSASASPAPSPQSRTSS